jgi:hypothetical protein
VELLSSQEPVKIEAPTLTQAVKKEMSETIINRGTGAGGANTNKNGKSFEEKTSNEERLLSNGFVKKTIPGTSGKYNYYLEKKIGDRTITFLTQTALKSYFMKFFNIELFRKPDEAYLLNENGKYTLKILEKKNQNVEGSVDTKLLAGPTFIEEYKLCLGESFEVEYAFCISKFLQTHYESDEKKYRILRQILENHNVSVFFGEESDYFTKIDSWIYSSS